MYGVERVYRFYVRETEGGCAVALEMEDRNAPRLIHQAFSLLESLMVKEPGHDVLSKPKDMEEGFP